MQSFSSFNQNMIREYEEFKQFKAYYELSQNSSSTNKENVKPKRANGRSNEKTDKRGKRKASKKQRAQTNIMPADFDEYEIETRGFPQQSSEKPVTGGEAEAHHSCSEKSQEEAHL